MEEIKIDEIMDVIEFKDKPLCESVGREEKTEEDEIRLYVPPRKVKRTNTVLRFLITTAIFFLLFFTLALLIKDGQADKGEDTQSYLPTVSAPEVTQKSEESDVAASVTVYPPTVIDESKTGIDININEEYSLNPLIRTSDGMKILIVHTHNSESVSDSLIVSDAGSVIAQLLNSAGIETYHCLTEHDKEGNIGAYLRMKESLTSLIDKYPDAVCVIDIHDSDSGHPVTFTVGTDGVGWNENLRLAEAVCGKMASIETAFRFLPGTLGQDSGVLTLNVGLGGKNFGDEEVRAAIASFANAFIEICNEKASAP